MIAIKIGQRKSQTWSACSFPGKGHFKPQHEELRRLQRENANLKEEQRE